MKARIEKLLTIKSIVTIVFTFVVAYQSIKGVFDIKDLYYMIIAFYFGTQTEKKKGE